MTNSLSLIVLSVVFGIGGQISLKMGMDVVGKIDDTALAHPVQIATRVLTTPLVLAGLSLYVLGAIVWLTVLSRVPLSLAYPYLALSYAFTPALAWIFLGEAVPSLRWLGIAIICAGVVVVSRT
jgi:drug/metabolite transporter (DMT)-like permease